MSLSRSKPMPRGTSQLTRSGFKPREPMQPGLVAAPKKEPKPPKGPRRRKCAVCKELFEPRSMTHKACKPECAVEHAVKVSALQKAKQQRQERAQDKIKREGMKTYPQLIRDAQAVFNAVVRLRDQIAGWPCISSGKPLDWTGNAVDAGHYRSRGSAPHLRFNFDNCHAQSKQDNRYGSGEAVAYRIGLIARIGIARVEALEADNTSRKWTHDELRAMKEDFQRQVRELKKELQNEN